MIVILYWQHVTFLEARLTKCEIFTSYFFQTCDKPRRRVVFIYFDMGERQA